ncbi:MAG TPA: hypothetical protein VK190_04980 [Pseudoneobacillus sp.]|nr:hypothetical protein [Pseudoneobacillus sp.]
MNEKFAVDFGHEDGKIILYVTDLSTEEIIIKKEITNDLMPVVDDYLDEKLELKFNTKIR